MENDDERERETVDFFRPAMREDKGTQQA